MTQTFATLSADTKLEFLVRLRWHWLKDRAGGLLELGGQTESNQNLLSERNFLRKGACRPICLAEEIGHNLPQAKELANTGLHCGAPTIKKPSIQAIGDPQGEFGRKPLALDVDHSVTTGTVWLIYLEPCAQLCHVGCNSSSITTHRSSIGLTPLDARAPTYYCNCYSAMLPPMWCPSLICESVFHGLTTFPDELAGTAEAYL